MPYLLDTETRTDCLVVSINHLLARDGIKSLTLRRIAKESGVSTSSMLHHFGSREHLLRVAAGQTGRARLSELGSRMHFQGVAGFLPEGQRDLPDARAWLAWLELSRSEESLVAMIGRTRASERALLAHTLRLRNSSATLDSVAALVDGLLVAVCEPSQPLSIEKARDLLTRHVDLVQDFDAPDVTPARPDGSTGRTREENDMTTTPTPTTNTSLRTSTARVPLEHPGSLLARGLNFWTRRAYGHEMEPMQALLHHRKVTTTIARFEMGIARWTRLDTGLKELAQLSVASQIGCSWCMDFGYYLSRTNGMAVEKLEQVTEWRSSTVYTPLERKVLEYAEAMTATPPTVTDEMVARLRDDLDDAQLVELTEMISVENLRSRTNSALGLTSQGFKSRCDLPSRPVK